ncbi:MAG: transposase [Acidobacteriota bacterium]|nr:transposase [Acidobacteriota bacterium]
MPNRPGRFTEFDYIGLHTYFLTICTDHRQPAFADLEFGAWAATQLLRHASARAFSVIAYSLMPDHVHLVLQGQSDAADLKSLILSWNTRTAYAWRVAKGTRLWQSGYYDHVLREGESVLGVARYVLMNPVRAGLVHDATDYPLSGSSAYSIQDILAAAQDWKPSWQ